MEVPQSIRYSEQRRKIDLSSALELQYWSEKFNISGELLREIVKIVGADPNAVEHELEVGGTRSRSQHGNS